MNHSAIETPVTVCIIDTGVLRASVTVGHIIAGINLTGDGDAQDIFCELNDHGTRVAETILEECPEARLAVLRVMDHNGWLRTMEAAERAFSWVLQNLSELEPVVICAAFGDMFHYRGDEAFAASSVQRSIRRLRAAGVLTVTAAGNMYPRFSRAQAQGMAWPAILRETVSVGALHEEAQGALELEWFSQRLHATFGSGCATTLFALPGPPGDTSGAAARVAGRLAALRQADARASAEVLQAILLKQTMLVHDSVTGLAWPALST